MQELELYRKYRPKTFSEVFGNVDTMKALVSEYHNGSHVFLLTGPAGTGKSTVASIMAQSILKSTQVIVINSSDNRGIDTTRDIMQKMQYKSFDGTPTVWILEEVHMMTSAAQNSLLKPLEETPAHCYFFLTTTNPEKLINPLKTRCSLVNLKPLNAENMCKLLTKVCNLEGFTLNEEVVDRIVTISEGSSRKALKLLAKVRAFDTSEKQVDILKSEVSLDVNEAVLNFCRVLYKPSPTWSELAQAISNLNMPVDNDPESVRMAVLGYGNSILLKKPLRNILDIMVLFSDSTLPTGKYAITMAVAHIFLRH